MRLKDIYYLSEDEEDRNLQIEEALRNISRAVNGTIKEFTPIIYGSGTHGTVTYTTQVGWYVRQVQIVDYWFHIAWSNWVGGVGEVNLLLPLKTWMSGQDFWIGSLSDDGISYPNAGHGKCVPKGIQDSYVCEFPCSGNGVAAGNAVVQATGSLYGHIRYLGQSDE